MKITEYKYLVIIFLVNYDCNDFFVTVMWLISNNYIIKVGNNIFFCFYQPVWLDEMISVITLTASVFLSIISTVHLLIFLKVIINLRCKTIRFTSTTFFTGWIFFYFDSYTYYEWLLYTSQYFDQKLVCNYLTPFINI